MYIFYKKGFTLIELLVVISIISLLSSVVFSSLNSARNKGADAAILSNMDNMRAQAALYHDQHNTYVGFCSDTTVSEALKSILSASGALSIDINNDPGALTSVTCNDDETGNVDDYGWAIQAPLKTDPTKMYCVDKDNPVSTKNGNVLVGNAYNDKSCD